MFPSYDDFGVAGLFSFMVYRENPSLTVEFRVMQPGEEDTIVSYGFKGTALEDIRKLALEYRDAVALKADVTQIEMRQNLSITIWLKTVSTTICSMRAQWILLAKDAEVCRTHPQYFIWPSDRFFIHYRPQ